MLDQMLRNQDDVNFNIANSSLNDVYGLLYSDFVRIIILGDRIDSAAALTAFPRIILLYKLLTIIINLPFEECQRVR